MANGRRSAFTLIEVLIVVIIMAVLAATIIPQFSSSTTDAKTSSLKFNLHTIRSQIEMYKIHHGNVAPLRATFAEQMTKPTDAKGSTEGTTATLIYGPYIQGEVPANPFNNNNALAEYKTTTDPTGVADETSGWQYNETTGGFFPNNSEYFENTTTTTD